MQITGTYLKIKSYRPRNEYGVNSSRYPVTLPYVITAKIAGFRVKPGMTKNTDSFKSFDAKLRRLKA